MAGMSWGREGENRITGEKVEQRRRLALLAYFSRKFMGVPRNDRGMTGHSLVKK
jgi:hypothetical protein